MNIIKETLSVKGIQIEISTDIESVLWSKLILVGSVGTLMASTRSSFLEIIESPYGLSVCEKMMSEIFLAAQSKNVSDSTAKIIDDEVRFLAEEAENNCRKILKENIEELHIVAKGLLEYETLTGEEIKDLVKGIKPSRDDFDEGTTTKETITSSVPKTGDSTAPQIN